MELKQNCAFFILLILIVNSHEITTKCVCGHVKIQAECQNSAFCYWQNDVCFSKPGVLQKEGEETKEKCQVFAEEDCRVQKYCGFYQGNCQIFVNCKIFSKDNCQQSSYRCVSDGKECVEKLECNDYQTEQGCQNQNQNGGYCIWIQKMEKKCQDINSCEQLPIYLTSHTMCKEGLDGCTVDNKGHGCMKLKELCSQYEYDFQCFESNQNLNYCFWDYKNEKCVEKICENLPFTQDYECQSYINECTSNGNHCILRKLCSDAKNIFGCVTDINGNKCVFHQNQCKIKTCDTALDSFTNYQQCQNYDNLLDCVTSKNGGCKQRPQSCEGYVDQIDCYSIVQEDCIWYNNNKCVKRECQYAPDYYGQKDCRQYGNCIGKLTGGCQDSPDNCNQILEEQFCEFNYNKEKCIWLDGECTLLECIKLKLPTYKDHQICQKVSPLCTFNLQVLGCADNICENITEIEYCSVDSKGTICAINQGCIDKKCKTAPISYDSNEKCEQWLPYCTVNLQRLQNSYITVGCVDKQNKCEVALKEQCYSTISGVH
ncbi:unnamed protein product [Paramecium primaurelia]|uniref:Uncharacterized protein n=1 Tax=Paramecium primaurelia TaxID=5886 RepID=A0A8S1JX24_PARPR|nr:unnamed protein product [Paramecium primaurelia]